MIPVVEVISVMIPAADVHWSEESDWTPREGSAAGVRTEITSTGIALIGPASDFSGVMQYRCSRPKFWFRLKAGKNLHRDHRYLTKSEKTGARPISEVPVVEVRSVVTAAAEGCPGQNIFLKYD